MAGSSAIRGLYAITQDEPDTAALLRKVEFALKGGAGILQYRSKLSDAALHVEQACALRELTSQYGVPLIVNDDAALALKVDADGVHLGGGDGSVADARALLGDKKIIGVSCYNRLDLAHEAVLQGADYVAFGAVFASTVKPGAPVASLALIRRARAEIAAPIVAIGGIDLQNGASVFEAGADALAVISALFGAEDIGLAAGQFINLKN